MRLALITPSSAHPSRRKRLIPACRVRSGAPRLSWCRTPRAELGCRTASGTEIGWQQRTYRRLQRARCVNLRYCGCDNQYNAAQSQDKALRHAGCNLPRDPSKICKSRKSHESCPLPAKNGRAREACSFPEAGYCSLNTVRSCLPTRASQGIRLRSKLAQSSRNTRSRRSCRS
jgi:hypothetical protein